MAVSESSMAEFKMAAIIKLSQNEWVKFILCKMAESKMAAIIKLIENVMSLSQIELVWIRVLFKMAESKMAEFKMAAIQDGCHHQVESEWMSESEFFVNPNG